jgi:hypothetical protein
MKQSIILIAILFSFNTLFAHDNGTKKPVDKLERISGDRFFYVTYRYTDACGIGRVGAFVWATRHARPKESDLIFRAADLTCGDYHCIQITGRDAICEADYKGLSK